MRPVSSSKGRSKRKPSDDTATLDFTFDPPPSAIIIESGLEVGPKITARPAGLDWEFAGGFMEAAKDTTYKAPTSDAFVIPVNDTSFEDMDLFKPPTLLSPSPLAPYDTWNSRKREQHYEVAVEDNGFRISISEGDDYPFIVQLVEGSKAQTQGAIFPGLVFTEIDGNSVVGKSEREVKAMLKASAAPRLTVPHGAPDAANIFEKLHRFEELEKARFAQWEEAYVEYDRLSDAEKKARSLGTDEKHKPVPRPPDFLARMPNGE